MGENEEHSVAGVFICETVVKKQKKWQEVANKSRSLTHRQQQHDGSHETTILVWRRCLLHLEAAAAHLGGCVQTRAAVQEVAAWKDERVPPRRHADLRWVWHRRQWKGTLPSG